MICQRRIDKNQAAWSPDLNSLNFFLEGYLNDRVYKNHPKTPNEPEQSVCAETMRIAGKAVAIF